MIKSFNISWANIRPGDVVILRDPLGNYYSFIALRESFFGTKFMALYKDKNGNVDLSLLHPKEYTITTLSLILRNYSVKEIDRTYRELYKRAYAHKFK
nr:MAG TPA: tRNA methyltransferase complex GCD14 subunit N-term [Caudoviricetes sp.]DAS99045.1 MAG TPA: tRNA methyltransferase complex GCD14 subunit N-term [Caudoviricetes sp.]